MTGDNFGHSVAISENAVLVGADDDDFGSTQTREGSAYVIDRTTAPPPPFSPCETEIEVNITTDQPDADIDDDVCDVDANEPDQQCSMRAAIETANAKAGPDEISFNIEGAGPHTISPATALPAITDKVLIDATTQPDYSASPLIELSGNGGFAGLTFAAGSGDSSVSGLAINRFLAGISLQTSGIKIERNY
ncbi:MAG: FG-GAP repeat protein, partial [Pyrinomonadaceae bacterium]|nr:FG-GAP repeat protein [Pyrinomonadaceae bacterium]